MFGQQKAVFFDYSYFSASSKHCWNQKETVFKEKAYSCQWTTDFSAIGSHFFLHFSETSANNSFFQSIGKVFFHKILHLQVETDIRANNGFYKQENKRMLFPLDKNLILSPRMRDLLKRFALRGKTAFTDWNI